MFFSFFFFKSSNAEHAGFLFMPGKENERTVIVKRCIIQGFWTHPGRSDFVASFVSWKNKRTKSCQCQLFCLIYPCALVLFFFFLLLYLRRLVFTLCTWLWLWLTAVFHYCSTSPRALVSVTSGWSQLLRALPGSADLLFLSLNM